MVVIRIGMKGLEYIVEYNSFFCGIIFFIFCFKELFMDLDFLNEIVKKMCYKGLIGFFKGLNIIIM